MGRGIADREIYSGLRVLPPFIVRADGRSFHALAGRSGFVRPFDDRFSRFMAETSTDVIFRSGLPATAAYTFSDEISIYFPQAPFGGRVEKINSVLAAYIASSLTLRLRPRSPVAFDCRIMPSGPEEAADYFTARQHEAWRNHINAWCQHILVSDGLSTKDAAARLMHMKSHELHELAYGHGVNLARTPAWQRRGVMVYREPYETDGTDPRTGTRVRVTRNRMVVDRDLPLFYQEEGREFLKRVLSGGTYPD